MWALKKGNAIIADIDSAKEDRKLRTALGRARGQTQTHSPQIHRHVQKKEKKRQILHERDCEIQYENKMLLQKMLKIDIDGTVVNKDKQVPETFKSNVLTNPARFRNLERIHNENKQLLSRLRQVKSGYSTKSWA